MTERLVGKITWFNIAKRYGELRSQDGKLYFFSQHDKTNYKLLRQIRKNSYVTFKESHANYFQLPIAEVVELSESQMEILFK